MEPEKIKKIFVDSDAFVALAKADDTNHLKAQEILNQPKNVSFVDCANIALIKHDRLDAIFSFDRIYKKNGLTMAWDL